MLQTGQDDSSSSSTSYDSGDCLADLLGGISMDGNMHWQEEEASPGSTAHNNQTQNHGRVDLDLLQKQQEEQRKQKKQSDFNNASSLGMNLSQLSSKTTSSDKDDVRFRNAHGPMQEQSGGRPKVAICDMGDTQQSTERGKGLVATDFIPKGSIVFTEKAAIATQVPNPNSTMIRACQACFRSLEPLSTLSSDLPCPELWPVLPLQWKECNEDDQCRSDSYGRMQCRGCQAFFCSKYCYDKEQQEMKRCCNFSWGALLGTDVYGSGDDEEQGSPEETPNTVEESVRTLGLDHAPVALAAKIFCHATEYYRQRQESVPNDDDKQVGVQLDQRLMGGHFVWGLCGDADDLDALGIGVLQSATTATDTTVNSRHYTLDPLYQYLTKSLELTKTEQETLSLSFLHMLASKTARNGFGIRTQSPFKSYYSGLLRKFGRDSDAHKLHMRQVAMALSSSSSDTTTDNGNGKDHQFQLERGMDRLIDEKVAPWIAGIFTLTAHLNHSCEPNAMVMSQEFVDSHIDLVAKHDIQRGEEILISYIQGVQHKSTNQRRRELEAKYLFTCGCSKCTYS